jgi:hypothetical protein
VEGGGGELKMALFGHVVGVYDWRRAVGVVGLWYSASAQRSVDDCFCIILGGE